MSAAKYLGHTLLYGQILEAEMPTYRCLDIKMNPQLRLRSVVRDLATLQNAQKGGRVTLHVALCADMLRDWKFGSCLFASAERYGAELMSGGLRLVLELGPEAGFFWRDTRALANLNQLSQNGVRFGLRTPVEWARQKDVLAWIKGEGKPFLDFVLIPQQDLLKQTEGIATLFEREMPVIATSVTHKEQKVALAARGYHRMCGPLAGFATVDEISDRLRREASTLRRYRQVRTTATAK